MGRRGAGRDGGLREQEKGKQLDPQAPPSHGRHNWPSVCRHFTFPLTASLLISLQPWERD